jgi:hypothetical protein
MAQEFLDRAQIAAAAQEMRCERMTQGMRRGILRQSQGAAEICDGELNDARR